LIAGITDELQEPVVHGGSASEDNGPVPQQSAPDFRRHKAPQRRPADALPASGENLHALQCLIRSLSQSAGNCAQWQLLISHVIRVKLALRRVMITGITFVADAKVEIINCL